MKHYALIGNPLGHSWSQRLFEEAVPATVADYRLFELPSLDGLRQWVSDNDISGFNVTTPYKEAILPQLDTLSREAVDIGAVNCVKVTDNRLVGYNTDASAFRQTLEEALTHSHIHKLTHSLILGTGGAARAVAYALQQLGIKHTFVSRHPEQHTSLGHNIIGYNQLSTFSFQLSTLLVNATPVGMYPNIATSPLPSDFQFSTFNFQLCYDLIYNPSPTMLMRQVSANGVKVVDGLSMLRLQAKFSRDIFFSNNTDYPYIVK